MLKLWLIRHGMTEGNRHGRYIGVTDEALCEQGKDALSLMGYPMPQAVYVSPMLRCTQTAGILFPGKSLQIIEELSECHFGKFENKNYQELSKEKDYQAWIDSNGMAPFPGGESREEFQKRTLRGFQKAVNDCVRRNLEDAALVVHGGTIMNIMEEYCTVKRSFYEWHVKNGGGYLVELNKRDWINGRRELNLCYAFMEG